MIAILYNLKLAGIIHITKLETSQLNTVWEIISFLCSQSYINQSLFQNATLPTCIMHAFLSGHKPPSCTAAPCSVRLSVQLSGVVEWSGTGMSRAAPHPNPYPAPQQLVTSFQIRLFHPLPSNLPHRSFISKSFHESCLPIWMQMWFWYDNNADPGCRYDNVTASSKLLPLHFFTTTAAHLDVQALSITTLMMMITWQRLKDHV